MIHAFVRRSADVEYLTADPADELRGLRRGGPGWWLRGDGDERCASDVSGVLTTMSRAAVTGYDLIIAAPRPLSILIAIDQDVAPVVIAAHRSGVAAAIDYLEDRALVVRRRTDGDEFTVGARWSRVVSFTHGVNRAGEPHLHDHVLVGALPEGESTVVDSRSLVAHLAAADSLYRAAVRAEVNQRSSRSAWRTFGGEELVGGVDEGYRALWGGYADERGPKTEWSRSGIIARWRDDLERFQPIAVPLEPRHRTFDEHRFLGAFEGAPRIARRDIVRAWADASPFGVRASDLSDAIDRLHPNLRLARGLAERPLRLYEARRLVPEMGRDRDLVADCAEERYRERGSRARSR